jgi:hypothetical protein
MKQKNNYNNRISIIQDFECTEIRIKAYSDEVKQKMFLAWIVLWTISGLLIFSQFFFNYSQKEKVFFIIWLAFWLYFEYKSIQTFRWRKYGLELIKINESVISITRIINESGIPATFKLNACKNFRVYPKEEKGVFADIISASYWVIGGESIAFDYYGNSVPFAMNISASDALHIVSVLKHDAKKFIQLSEQKQD